MVSRGDPDKNPGQLRGLFMLEPLKISGFAAGTDRSVATVALFHSLSQLDEHLVRVGHADQADARVFEIDDHIDGH